MVKIGIVSLNHSIDNYPNVRLPFTYVNAIKNSGGTPIVLPVVNDDCVISDFLQVIDGLVIPGGDDINPKLYQEDVSTFSTGIDDKLDEFQIKIIKKALSLNLPILGICRGHQVLNVAFNGTLIQDINFVDTGIKVIHDQLKFGIPRNQAVHEVNLIKDSKLRKLYGDNLMTNSFHHQIIGRLGNGLKATGYTKDGVVEGIESINHDFVLGVQWHPERTDSNKTLFDLFINECEKRRNEKNNGLSDSTNERNFC